MKPVHVNSLENEVIKRYIMEGWTIWNAEIELQFVISCVIYIIRNFKPTI